MELTLRARRLKYFWFLLVSAAFTVIGAFMIRDRAPTGWLVLLFFGASTIVFCVLLIPGSAYLKLRPASFTVCSLFRTSTTRWDAVDRFETGHVGLRKLVVFNYSDSFRRYELARKISSTISGHEGALPETYGLSTEELAALMNEWRQCAGASGTPGLA
jgi:hypothetical protein